MPGLIALFLPLHCPSPLTRNKPTVCNCTRNRGPACKLPCLMLSVAIPGFTINRIVAFTRIAIAVGAVMRSNQAATASLSSMCTNHTHRTCHCIYKWLRRVSTPTPPVLLTLLFAPPPPPPPFSLVLLGSGFPCAVFFRNQGLHTQWHALSPRLLVLPPSHSSSSPLTRSYCLPPYLACSTIAQPLLSPSRASLSLSHTHTCTHVRTCLHGRLVDTMMDHMLRPSLDAAVHALSPTKQDTRDSPGKGDESG